MWRKLRSAASIVILTIVFAAALKSCVVDAYRIPTSSMSGTLLPGDFLLVNKFIYGARTPATLFSLHLPRIQFPKLRDIQRGNVVVFEFPGDSNEVHPVRRQYIVKRCAGIPSDTVEITKGKLLVNRAVQGLFGNEFAEEFRRTVVPFRGMRVRIDSTTIDHWKTFIRREGHTVERYNGKIFIDGSEASDYTVEQNYYFALGDNVNNSYDSRYWGCIPEENMIGQAVMIYWSKDETGIRWNRIGSVIR